MNWDWNEYNRYISFWSLLYRRNRKFQDRLQRFALIKPAHWRRIEWPSHIPGNRLTISREITKLCRYDNYISECDTTETQENGGITNSGPTFDALVQVATLCNRAEFKAAQEKEVILKRECTGDASEIALLKFTEMTTGNVLNKRKSSPKVAEIPFNSTNK